MSLTVVSSFLPWPQDRGDPVRVLMMLRAISRVSHYTLLVVRRPETTVQDSAQLRSLLPNVHIEEFDAIPYRLGSLGPIGRYAESLVASMPPWVRTRYSAALHESLRTRQGGALALGEAAGAYVEGTSLRWHWDKSNVLAASTRQDIDTATDAPRRWRARYLAQASTQYERRVLRNCATVSVTSSAEADRLASRHGRKTDLILPSAFAMPKHHHPSPQDRELVWLSSFAYPPNVIGLRRFLTDGWPRLRVAGYVLRLVGSGLSDELRGELAAVDGIEQLGYVEDLRPVLARARAAVVPVWSGAGVKLKTLTLLAHSVPVFSTDVGAEGIPETPAVRVTNTPAGLAEAIASATPELLDRMAAQAPRVIETHFSEGTFAARLTAFLRVRDYLPVDES